MPGFKIALLVLLHFLVFLAEGSKCPADAISKLVVCYYEGESPITNLNVCNCTHVVFTKAVRKTENNSISAIEGTIRYLDIIKEKKENLTTIFTLETKSNETSMVLKSENKSEQLINSIVDFLQESHFDGVELNFKFSSDDGITKESFASFVKNLSKTLSSHHHRVKRDGYDVFEKLQDDVTTAAYTTQTPKNSTSKTQSIKQRSRKTKEGNRKIREKKDEDVENDTDYLTLEEAINTEFSQEKQNSLKDVEDVFEEKKLLVFVRLSVQPEIIAKKYDLKSLSRYADILTVPTHYLINKDEKHLTYHPSRLMGLSDILNTDSILDFLTGMGGLKSKMVISLPAVVLKFQLKDEKKNTPRSPTVSKPEVIDQSQLCGLFSKNNWTLERDDDLTAPYAFSGKIWLAFEDEISVNIKGKYILLRELAGGAIYPIDSDLNDGSCSNRTGTGGYLTGILHQNFESLERKPRALVLESLQDEIHDASFINAKAGVQVSEYRIVRVVDHSGAVHVIRRNTKTQFECSRQGYFSHPLGCNKFYRCVKFDQYSNEFTVFEYDCPTGLAFDERWEVCVWPGSLPHGAPCTGSSEIAPVPRSHYQCPNHEGYFADPENCRWFFACLDHVRDGITPLTAYEFRCPFGLVFSEEKLACDWPWLVGSCGNRGAAGYLNINGAGQSQGIHSGTFINGGNLEASFGQYDNLDQRASFIGFGQKFGSGLRESGQSIYQGAQSAGYGYIASQFDDDRGKASFAAFPEYEISGGRIVSKGGVVLDQNIAGVSTGSIGDHVGNLGAVNIRGGTSGESRSLGEGAGYFQQEIVHSGIRTKPQSLEQASVKTSILETSGSSSADQTSLLTPKPFSVHVPSVQINKEYSEHSTFESATPQNLVFAETPQTENIENVNIQLTDIQHAGVKQYSTPRGFTVSQPAISVTAPVISPTLETHTLGGVIPEGYDSTHFKSDVSLNIPSFDVKPKTEFHRFGQTSLRQNEFSSKISATQSPLSARIPAALESFGYSSGASGAKEAVSFPVQMIKSKPDIHTFEYTASSHAADISQPSVSTQKPFVDFAHKITDQNGRKVLEHSLDIPQGIPVVQTHTFRKSEGLHLVTGNIGIGQTGLPLGVVTPSVTTSVDSGSHLSEIPSGFVQSSIDDKVSNELKFNKPQNTFSVPAVISKTNSEKYSGQFNVISNQIPLVTPRPDFHLFSQAEFNSNSETGKSQVTVSYDVPAVTPQPDLNPSGYYREHVTQTVPFDLPGVTSAIKNSFHQTETSEVLKDFSKTPDNVPVSIPKSDADTFEFSSSLHQKGISQEGKKSYGVPLVTSEIKNVQTQQISHGFFKPTDVKFSQLAVPVQPAFGQRYSYSSSFKQSENQLGVTQPFGAVSSTPKPVLIQKTQVFVPKPERSKPLTEITVEPQPIVSVGTISSAVDDQTLSTPNYSQGFSQSSGISNINFKSTFVQPEVFAVTTPAPLTSITPSAIYEEVSGYSGVNIDESPRTIILKQQEKINTEFHSPTVEQTIVSLPGKKNFDQKSHLEEEINSFAPVAHVTSSVPTTYNQNNNDGKSFFYEKTSGSFPPTQHELAYAKGSQILVQKEQSKSVVNNHIEFLKTKPLIEEKRTGFAPNQPLVQITTSAPMHQQSLRPAFVTGKPFAPREQLVRLEITKSIEVNPSEFFHSAEEQLPVKPIEIQQQPLQFISQKRFPVKQQAFYQQQEKEIISAKNNKFPGSNHHQQLKFEQQTNINIPQAEIVEQKQYLLPVVTSKPQINSPVNTVNVEQPVIYPSAAPELPIFQTSKISLAGKADSKQYLPPSGFAKNSAKTVFVEQHDKQQPVISKINILQPISTEPPQYTPSIAEELTVQTHKNFDSKKINTFGTTPLQSVFIQPEIHSTLKPAVDIFQTSGYLFKHNLTAGSGHLGSGFKYAINPNIEIPQPPREYILAQNDYSTITPDLSTVGRTNQFQSSSTESLNQRFEGSTSPTPVSLKKPTEISLISIGNLNEEEIRDDNVQQIFDKYSGRFGQVIDGDHEKILTKVFSGQGKEQIDKEVSSTARYEVSSATPKQRTRGRLYHGDITSGRQATNKYEEYEINGGSDGQRSFEIEKESASKTTIDLKNLKVDKNKKTVIVVSQVSDANPVLIGKLAGQCSCQSNMLELRTKGKKSKGNLRRKNKNSSTPQHSIITNEYLPPYEGSQSKIEIETLTSGGVTTAEPETVVIGRTKSSREGISYTEQNLVSLSTTAQPDVASSTILSSLGPDGVLSITPKALFTEERVRSKSKQFRGRTRYLSPSSLSEDGSSVSLLSPVRASEIESTFDYSALKGDESRAQNEIDGGRSKPAGAAFDRYGPGGWRGFDETLQGSIDCKRPGLFRHPKHCNKFYACNYDPWKEQFTLHVFNCPIHLTYDSSISACNWPVRGPACADDNLLV